jgi:hypothetical protein
MSKKVSISRVEEEVVYTANATPPLLRPLAQSHRTASHFSTPLLTIYRTTHISIATTLLYTGHQEFRASSGGVPSGTTHHLRASCIATSFLACHIFLLELGWVW